MHSMKKIKKGNDTYKAPYQHFQAQDHFESAHHKNWQSNIYLNQEYAPGVVKEESLLLHVDLLMYECM